MSTLHDLATAMRAGATIRPKVRGVMFGREESGIIGSCALGAAYEAETGMHPDRLSREEVEHRFMPCLHACARNPYTNRWQTIGTIVESLNDDHDWTRESIADFIDTLAGRHDDAHGEANSKLAA